MSILWRSSSGLLADWIIGPDSRRFAGQRVELRQVILMRGGSPVAKISSMSHPDGRSSMLVKVTDGGKDNPWAKGLVGCLDVEHGLVVLSPPEGTVLDDDIIVITDDEGRVVDAEIPAHSLEIEEVDDAS